MSQKPITIYYNPDCSKCRGSLGLIEQSESQFKVVEYLKTPPTEQELDGLLHQLDMEPAQIVRKGEDRYEELKLDQNPPATRQAWIRILCENPILIERPIVTDGTRAVLGRPPENVLKLMKGSE